MSTSNAAGFAHPRVARLDALTSLRFFAALYVVAFHYRTLFVVGDASAPGFFQFGYSGVTFFFLLSGFILAYNYKSVDFADGHALGDYLLARIARIYPVFLVSLLVSLPFFIKAVLQSTPHHNFLAAAAIILTPLGLHAWVPGAACALNCPSWSISTEFFFYAMFPLIFARVLRRPLTWCAATGLLLLTTWSLFALIWSAYGHGYALTGAAAHQDDRTNPLSQFIMYFPIGRLPEFIFGILLFAYWSGGARLPRPATLVMASVLSAAIILEFQSAIPDVILHNGLTAIVWAPLILAGASMRAGPLSAPTLVFLGRISFALYLLHIPTALTVLAVNKYWLGGALSSVPLLAALGTSLLAIAAAAAAYGMIEEPGRRFIVRLWRNRHARRAISLTTSG
jgi:peptidoglycan/LPS O-acetylase OafA/YrhL